MLRGLLAIVLLSCGSRSQPTPARPVPPPPADAAPQTSSEYRALYNRFGDPIAKAKSASPPPSSERSAERAAALVDL